MPSVAVVTGAGRGIGLAIAHRLADAGHRVVITDLDEAAAQAAAAEIGRGAVGLRQNVADSASHRDIASTAASLGSLEVWVNNAGVLFAGDAWSHTDDELAMILDVNVRGVMAGCAAAISQMGTGSGRILNIASISALTPVPGLALYAASKAAVLSYTTSLAGDLKHRRSRIRVHALCPDVVGTAMVTAHNHDPDAAMLFAGPKALEPDVVADAAMELIAGRQIFRVVPRWRGVLSRVVDLSPAVGLAGLALTRRLGEARQRRS